MAAVLHGVERVTLDIDLALRMNEPNMEKFLRVMGDSVCAPGFQCRRASCLTRKLSPDDRGKARAGLFLY